MHCDATRDSRLYGCAPGQQQALVIDGDSSSTISGIARGAASSARTYVSQTQKWTCTPPASMGMAAWSKQRTVETLGNDAASPSLNAMCVAVASRSGSRNGSPVGTAGIPDEGRHRHWLVCSSETSESVERQQPQHPRHLAPQQDCRSASVTDSLSVDSLAWQSSPPHDTDIAITPFSNTAQAMSRMNVERVVAARNRIARNSTKGRIQFKLPYSRTHNTESMGNCLTFAVATEFHHLPQCNVIDAWRSATLESR